MTTRVVTRPDAPTRSGWYASVDLGPGVVAGFTGGVPDASPVEVGAPGNLSHRRPHVPVRLAAERERLAARLGLTTEDLHFMRQVHGSDVAVIGPETPRGIEVRDVDALVTAAPDRALCVQVADCVPLLVASSRGPVAAVHAGRRGVEQGVVPAALATLAELGATADTLRAAIGPAIGGCCYEVPTSMQADLVVDHPAAEATTTWGTPSLDLPAAVEAVLRDTGVAQVLASPGCTRCDENGRWFSHRGDPNAGRQLGVIVRRGSG